MSYLRTVSRLSGGENPGGVFSLYVARKADVLAIPSPIGKVIVGDITFAEGAGFVEWTPTFGSTLFRSQGRASREGSSRNNLLEFSFPLDSILNRGMFEQAENDEFIVIYHLTNGRRKLFGTKEHPVKFLFDQDTGREITDGNTNKCRFYYEGPDNTYFYDGAITEQPASNVGARVEFTDGTLIALLSPTDVLVVSSDFAHTFTHVPGAGYGPPAIVRWDTGTHIAQLYPGDKLIVDTDFDFDFEIIETT